MVGLFGCFCDAGASGRFDFEAPDLGTSILVLASGFAVIFFAGLSWKFLLLMFSGVLVALPIVWNSLYDYQRQRVLTPPGSEFGSLSARVSIHCRRSLPSGPEE